MLNITHQFLPEHSRPDFTSRLLGGLNALYSNAASQKIAQPGFCDSVTTQKQDGRAV
jgi:hypothetical protein